MAKNNNLQDFLKDTADAIREKKGTDAEINAQDFHDEILSIQTSDMGTPIYEPVEPLAIATDVSYAHEGDSDGPHLSASASVSTGVDLTDFTTLTVVWDYNGSFNSYGEIYATIDLYISIEEIFRHGNNIPNAWGSDVANLYNGKVVSEFDITNVTGIHDFDITAYAYSSSPYTGYQSKACLNIYKMYIK